MPFSHLQVSSLRVIASVNPEINIIKFHPPNLKNNLTAISSSQKL